MPSYQTAHVIEACKQRLEQIDEHRAALKAEIDALPWWRRLFADTGSFAGYRIAGWWDEGCCHQLLAAARAIDTDRIDLTLEEVDAVAQRLEAVAHDLDVSPEIVGRMEAFLDQERTEGPMTKTSELAADMADEIDHGARCEISHLKDRLAAVERENAVLRRVNDNLHRTLIRQFKWRGGES